MDKYDSDSKGLTEERIEYWNKFHTRFKEEIYPILFEPHEIDFNVAYAVWCNSLLVNNCYTAPPPDCEIIYEDEQEPWKS